VADAEVVTAMDGSFLGRLSADLVRAMLVGGSRVDYP
jgi:hypothetical protein